MIETITAILKGASLCSTVYKLLNENNCFLEIQRTLDKLIDSHLYSGIILLSKIPQSKIEENQTYLTKEALKEFVLAQTMYEHNDKKFLISLECTSLCEIILKEPHMAIKTFDTIAAYHYQLIKRMMLLSPVSFSFISFGIIPPPIKDLHNVIRCQRETANFYNIDINTESLESESYLTRINQMLKLK